MNTKSYFLLGCKLFGIYCLFNGVPLLVNAILTFFLPSDIPNEVQQAYYLTTIFMRLIPVLYVVAGFYLLGGCAGLYKFAYPEKDEDKNDFKEKFVLALKIFGVYLIISYFPGLLRDISELLTKETAPPMYQMLTNQQFNIVSFTTNITGLVLGLYLLRSGKWFINYGLKTS